MSKKAALWHPGKVPQVRAGFWWHAENATGLGTTSFSVPEGNGSANAMVQTTVASQPTLLNEKNTKAFRMRNAADSNPSLIGTAAAFQAGWTGATYVAGWFRLSAGTPTGLGNLFVHGTTTGNQSRINETLTAGSINGTISTDGSTINSNIYATSQFGDIKWYWVEYLYFLTGAGNTDRLKLFIDWNEMTRTGGSGNIPTSFFDANAKAGIGCRFVNSLANVDTTDWSVVYYANGIPKDSHRRLLQMYKSPV